MSVTVNCITLEETDLVTQLSLRYDLSVNKWSSMKPPTLAIKLTTVVTFQGYLYTIGGVNKDDEPLNSVQRYNPETNQW